MRHLPAQRRRIIPTPVGNAPEVLAEARNPGDHPHARGERFSGPSPVTFKIGSSPRPWGTHDRVADQVVPRRIIPTPVGNAE